jgi:diacylglycerol kinase family enzyme
MTGGKTVAILNREAGTLSQSTLLTDREQLDFLFQQSGIREIRLVSPGQVSNAVQREIHAGATAIVVGGGDGTINTAARLLRGTAVALGVVPLGTLNHFARSLGIPPDLESAVRARASAMPETVDLGEVNGGIFVNNSSIGIYARAVLWREQIRAKLGLGKYWSMALAGLRLLWDFPFFHLEIESDDKTDIARTPVLFLGNNRYEPEFLNMSRRESLNEGRLSVYYATRIGRLSLIKAAAALLFGSGPVPELKIMDAGDVTVRTRRKTLAVAVDGEVLRLRTPLRYRILPRALQVLRPREPS